MKAFQTLAAAFAIALFASCQTIPDRPAPERFSYSEPHMGTLMRITLFAESAEEADAAARAAFDRIAELNTIFSDYDRESELMRLCQAPPNTPVPVSDDLFTVLDRAQELARQSDGAFDITIGPLVRLWRTARREQSLPATEAIEAAKKRGGWQKLRLDRDAQTATLLQSDMQLDLGGIAKGYAADEALSALRKRGIDRALVAAAGDIAAGDPPPHAAGWRVAIESVDPSNHGPAGIVVLKNQAISTSGDTEQFLEADGVRYSHIVHPETGLGLTRRLGVTVIAPDATTTDSLATLVSVLGPERGLPFIESLPDTEAFIVESTSNGRIPYRSSKFPINNP